MRVRRSVGLLDEIVARHNTPRALNRALGTGSQSHGISSPEPETAMSPQLAAAKPAQTTLDLDLWVRIADAGIRVIDRDGTAALTVARVAADAGLSREEVEAQTVSYSIRELVCMRGWEIFADLLSAASGAAESPNSAVFAVASTFREFAAIRPGLHEVIATTPPRIDHPRFAAIGLRALRVFDEPFAAMGIVDEQRVHLARAIRCAVHGFISMEQNGQFVLASNREQTFRILIELLVRGIEQRFPAK